MNLALDAVEAQLAHLWEDEAKRSSATRVELMTVVAIAAAPDLAERARKGLAAFVAVHPSRTVLVVFHEGAPAEITAEVSLHRASAEAPARGDSITLDAVGGGREWLPENIDRFALPDLPVCLWWVGDLPDFDRLFDRLLACANVVVVNSREMDLRDLETLADIAGRSRDRYALNDLSWIRLRPLQELIARFFDDDSACASLKSLARLRIDFVPQERSEDPVGPQAALLFAWMAQSLGIPVDAAQWRSADGFTEGTFGSVAVRFGRRSRSDVMAGAILKVEFECDGARFDIERQDDPRVFRWASEVPGAAIPPQMLRVGIHEESTLLVRCLERPKRDRFFEACLATASRAFRSIAPRPSALPPVRAS